MISLKKLDKFFFKGHQNEIHVINDVSMELPEKGIVALFGKSGCGKTTLLNCIGGLDDVKSGEIEIDGKNIRKNTDDIRNQYIGYIFQNYNLNLKVNNYENVAEALRLCGMVDESEIEKRVVAALANVGMEKYINRMPDTLSGGQKQRIAIARAIVKNPKIILADEPTGNLDEANTIMIMDLLKSIAQDHLVVLVTHEANLVDYYCDRVIELKDGRIESTRDNENANGYVARDKSVVYLGELEKNEQELSKIKFETYGTEFPEDIVISLVNNNGNLLLKCNSPKVRFIDENSEITFKNESFTESERRREQESKVDMSELPPIHGKNYGRLFHFKNAAKESLEQLSGKRSKGNNALKKGIIFFTLIVILLLTTFGKQVKALLDASASYSHYTFYGYAETNEQLKKLYEAFESGDKGIDSVRNIGYAMNGDEKFSLDTAIFETFRYENMYQAYGAPSPVTGHGVMLPIGMTEKLTVLYGRNTDVKDGEAVISLELAKIFAGDSKVGYVKEPKDLLGLKISDYECKIVGIVDTDEPAMYVSDDYYYFSSVHYDGVWANDDINVGNGEVVYYQATPDDKKVGDTVNLYGMNFVIGKLISSDKTMNLNELLEEYYGITPDSEDIELEYNKEIDCYILKYMYEGGEEELYLDAEEFDKLSESKGVIKSSRYEMHTSDYTKLKRGAASNAEKVYVQVHANDIEKCSSLMHEIFGGRSAPAGVSYTLRTPTNIYDEATRFVWDDFVSQLTTLLVFILLLCVCVYLIMRGSIMSRVREIGIYRCIGVTRKNMTFRFMIESFMLTNKTILPTFICMVGVMHLITYSSGMDFSIFMPWWIVLPAIAVLYVITIVCGIIPVVALLAKTPSQIMAKYDV